MLTSALRIIVLGCLASSGVLAFSQESAQPLPQAGPRFVPNLGQWQQDFAYRCELPDGALFIGAEGLTWSLLNGHDLEAVHEAKISGIDAPPGGFAVEGRAYRTVFAGAAALRPAPDADPEAHYRNYFLGRDSSRWKGRVPEFRSLRIPALYPGTDLVLYGSQGSFKYDFILQPGARPERIVMQFEGLESLSLREDGTLVLDLGFGQVQEAPPLAWQEIRGERREIPCRFVRRGEGIGFALGGRYDTRYPLVIDPVLEFATFSGSTADNWGYTATYDVDGHLYGGGISFGVGYPVTLGAFQTPYGGGSGSLGCDIALTKYSPDGSTQIWSSYLGGSNNEFPQSLVCNEAGELFVYGSTGSADFPVTAGAYDPSFNGGSATSVTSVDFGSGTDIYVARISSAGNALLASTLIGGSANDGLNIAPELHYNYGDHARGEIILAADGGPIVASSTYSTNFPVSPGALQPASGGNQDGVLFHLNAGLSSLLWSTYLGGSLDDGAYSVKVHEPSGDLLLCGGTRSSNFPSTPGALHSTYRGGTTDGWAMRLPAGAGSILASTFLGTNGYDQAYFIERDDDGNAYVMGQTRGSYPITPGVYANPGSAQFVHKLDPALSSTVFSTVFGNGSSAVNISPTALLVDVCEQVYVSGWGGLVNTGFNPAVGSMTGLPLSADAFQTTTDGSDFYFFVLGRNAVELLYASYFGGGTVSGVVSREHVDGGTSRFDERGVIYQAVCAGCGGLDAFPTTPGSWSVENGSANCNLGTLKFSFELVGVEAASDAAPDVVGCAPFTVTFTNTSTGAAEYFWDFGDGSTSTDFEPSHLFDEVGIYTVMLVASDTNSCNAADTTFLTIIAGLDSIAAAFSVLEETFCDTLWASFTDLSSLLGPGTSSAWSLGDGTVRSGPGDFTHTYTSPGEYLVQLIVRDSLSCNQADTFSTVISYSASFSSDFEVALRDCLPVTASFANLFTEGDAYAWDFGDGQSGSGLDPVHVYEAPGTYSVTLTTTYCGLEQNTVLLVNVPPDPIAFFDDEPYAAIVNTPVRFRNLSQFAQSWLWEFGDGGTSNEENPTYVYQQQGTFTVCLTARNENGCEDRYCRDIDLEIEGFIDVPNAFSPNGDGVNDRFLVQGFGADDFLLRIYNRWGELVYEGRDLFEGWDGTFRGQPQEMDVYAWTLRVRFANNRLEERQGNLTLLR